MPLVLLCKFQNLPLSALGPNLLNNPPGLLILSSFKVQTLQIDQSQILPLILKGIVLIHEGNRL